MKVAYADPPYFGQGAKHYGKDHPGASTWDTLDAHRDLIGRLVDEYPMAWALSLSTPSLPYILPMVPSLGLVRVGAWVKPFASFKPNVNPGYAWEPVIFFGGRKLGREVPTVRDWHSANITLKRGTHGAKPESFCFWLFEFLGCQPNDDFHDLFPGSGAVTVAWEKWRNQTRLMA